MLAFLGACLAEPVLAQRNVRFTGDFETGQIQSNDSSHDGFLVHTLPIDQKGGESLSSANGGFGPSTPADTRVIRARKPPMTGNGAPTEETVKPRHGAYFLESSLHYRKDYSELNNGKRKPRSKFYLTGHKFDFDVEGYIGFSVYLPSNLEIEQKHAHRTMLYVMNTRASSTLVSIELSAPEVGARKWAMSYYVDDSSLTESKESQKFVDLGDISDDLGKWTDFVIRYRINPFSRGRAYDCPVNPVRNLGISGAIDADFPCDAGILQVWKATGSVNSDGNRKMTQFVDVEKNSVGLLPRKDPQIGHKIRVYKPTWQTASTTVAGPIWIGFDEIRFGEVLKDGTGYSDVLPSAQSCTSGCLGSANVKPRAPSNLRILGN